MKKKQPKYYVAQYGVTTKDNPYGFTEDSLTPPPSPYTAMQKPSTFPYSTPAEQHPQIIPNNTSGYSVEENKSPNLLGMFNSLAYGATAIANEVNSQKASRDERMQYLNKAIMPTAYENKERYSLNTNPAYMQLGGELENAQKIKNTWSSTPDQLEDLRMSELISQGVVAGQGFNTSPDGKALFQRVSSRYGQPHAQKLVSDMMLFNQDENYSALSPEDKIRAYSSYGNPELSDFKKRMNSFGYGATDTYNTTNEVGGQMQQNKNIAFKQAGGIAKANSTTPSRANVEAEKGEVVQDNQGNISQVDPNGNTHEQGGEFLPAVHRVLENTSNLRSDKNSKYLKLEPAQIEAILGVKTNKSMSHAEALVKANEQLESQRNKIVKQLALSTQDRPTLDRYGEASSKLNIEHFKALPTKEELFERLFNHQEHIKQVTGIKDNGSSKYGGMCYPKKMQLGGFSGSKLKLKTPAGNSDSFPDNMKFEDYLKSLNEAGFKYEGISDNAKLQKALYDYKLKNKEYDDIRGMWKEGMHLDGMEKAKQLGFVDDKGLFKPGVLDSEANLTKLGELYPDGKLGPRLLKLAKAKEPRIWSDDPEVPTVQAPVAKQNPQVTNTANTQGQPQSRFNEPLRWFDVASPIGTFLSSDRLAEKYNPAELNQLQLKLQDPTAALNQNQADFNTAIQAVQNTSPANAGVQLANLSNLTSRKYALNNQVLGNTENQNSEIKNKEIMYNTAVRDRQSQSNQQSREVFEEKVLTGKAKQQEQKLQSLDALYKTIAENRALNRNGNLIMKFSKAFDQYGDYNGYQSKFAPNPQLPQGTTNTKGNMGRLQGLQAGKNYYNTKTGKTLRFDGVNLMEIK